MPNKMKKDVSKLLKKVIETLSREFPSLGLTSDLLAYKETERNLEKVYFEVNMPVPEIFVGTLLKQLKLNINFRLVRKHENVKHNDWDYWVNASWSYVHPGNGRNGYSFCNIFMNADGSKIELSKAH